MNIVHVAHLGDITDLGTEEEWQRARSALLPLFESVSMTLVSGNHDLGENGSANTRASRMDSTFAPAELMVSGTFDGGVQNSFTLVEDRLLVLGLEFAPRAAVVAWASGVLAAHPERAAIVVTHAYLGPDGERYDHLGDAPQDFSPYQYGVASGGDVHDGEELWQALISQHENVVMVVSGHVPQGFEVLLSEGATVVAHDPKAMDEFKKHHDVPVELVTDPYAAVDGADALVLHTEWRVYQNPDFTRIKQLLRRPLLIDGRNVWSSYGLEEQGFEYDGIGVRALR